MLDDELGDTFTLENDEVVKRSLKPDPTSAVFDRNNMNLKAVDLNKAVFYPYTAICQLRMKFPRVIKPLGGTGFLVKPRLILTAGHNILHPDYGFADEMKVIIAGKAGSSKHRLPSFPPFKGDDTLKVSDEWLSNPVHGKPYDYGFIILPESYDNKMGTFGLEPLELLLPRYRELASVTIAGYPCDRQNYPEINCDNLYKTEGKITEIEETMIHYRLDTLPCMSGSPIFYIVGNKAVAIGIHTKANLPASNKGVSLTPAVIKDINNHKG